jgi:hypothetical protein
MEIFRLFGSIFIENEKASKSLRDTEKQATDVGKTLQETTKVAIKFGDELGKRLTDVGSKMTKVAGIPLAALKAAMLGLAKTTADYTATVMDNARVVGLSVEAYQELQYAMAQSGLSQDDFVRMMGRVNQRIGMARQGNEKYRKSLQNLGISLEDVDKGLVGTEETFLAMIDYLHQMEDSQQQAAVAGDFFGVMLARRMMPLIKDGAQSVEELRQRAYELGLVMDDLAIAKGDLLSDTLDDLSFTAKGLARIFGSEMHAPMINISKAITDVIARFSTWLTENPKVVRQIIVWGGAIAGVLGVLVTLGTTMIVTGKIIGALGAIFNILTSKPVLIIAAIGALYLAWESDWLGIRNAVEDAWAIISPVIDAIIKWGKEKLETTWNWTTENLPKFLKWISETAWPWFNDKVSTAWNWSKGKVSDFIIWIQETAWPFINNAATTTWNWSRGKVGDFLTWIKEVAWPFLDGVATTTWNWVEGEAVPAVVQAGKAVINAVVEVSGKVYDAIKKGLNTGDWADFWDITSDLWSKGVVIGITLSQFVKGFSAVVSAIRRGLGLAAAAGAGLAGLGLPGLIGLLSVGIQLIEAQAEGSYEEFARNVIVAGLASVLGATVGGGPGAMLAFNVAVNLKLGNLTGFELLWDWISYNLEKVFSLKFGEMMSLAAFSKEWAKRKVREEMGIAPDAPSAAEIYTGERLLLQTIEDHAIKNSARVGAGIGTSLTLDELLDAIYKAEGGAKARVPYGMTGFADGIKYRSEIDQARFQELSQGLDVGSEDYWRAAAQTTVEHYWRWFKTRFPELGEKTFDEVGPELQSMFIAFLGSHFSPPDAHELNPNWVPNVLDMVGFEELAEEFRSGGENIMDAWIDAISDKAGDVEAVVDLMARIVAKYMVGSSPPPEGPLSDIDEGGAAIMEAWTEGVVEGLDEGKSKLTTALEKIRELFSAIWEKVPEEIRGPIEQAMTWMTDLIGQAEEALFKLDDFQEELDALMGGGASPEEQAQGFMTRLIDGLNEKLDKLDEPMNRFTDAIFSAGRSTLEFGKALLSGNWIEAFLTILMETESFAKAMELLGAVLDPVIALFDAVLAPIINFLLKLWNGIIDALSKIEIFGWKPFGNLANKKIDPVGKDKDEPKGGGRQVSEITGPTRDLLVDLLSPLANFGAIVAPIHDIRNILYERMPNFNAFSLDFAGAGAIGGDIVFESGAIVINSSGTSATELSRDMLDAIEREMARRVNFGIRGRGGR